MMIRFGDHQAYAYTGGKPFDPALPCVVFIHGALHDHSAWTLPARWLAHHGHSVLAVDQPGHMRSIGPVCSTVEAIGQWLLELLNQVGPRQVTLVGHSMGSLIALEAAAQAPDRIQTLVMVGTAYPMVVSDALLEAARERPAQGIEMVNNFSISTWASKPGYPGPGFWLHGGNRALMHRVLASNAQHNLFSHDFRLCNDYRGAEVAMPRVKAHSHLVLGARDQMTLVKATAALRQGLSAAVHTVAAGHGLMHEDPEDFLRVLRAITASVQA
ncbi:MAG: alpha/beta fold hydrolase [Burkholderiaceae bacterium]|jgi:pimeloyl-ACP methyl ester carboxylesterase